MCHCIMLKALPYATHTAGHLPNRLRESAHAANIHLQRGRNLWSSQPRLQPLSLLLQKAALQLVSNSEVATAVSHELFHALLQLLQRANEGLTNGGIALDVLLC